MPEEPSQLPKPDALRHPRPAAPRPPVSRLLEDPLASKPAPPADDEEKPETPASGLADLDAPHAVLSVLGSGIGRVILIAAVCILAFGLTESCHRASRILDGWRNDGLKGFILAVIKVPGATFASPVHWLRALVSGLTSSATGVPYLMLVIGGIILAVRSEIHILSLCLFYALLTVGHAAVFFEMKNPLSIALWLGLIAGIVWLYRWLWDAQNPDDSAGDEDELDSDAGLDTSDDE